MPKIEDRKKLPFVPKDLDTIYDLLGWMMLYAPKCDPGMSWVFEDNIDLTFFGLNEGLKVVRREIGEEVYARLAAMSQQMRAHFDSDPEDKNGGCHKGRILINQMSDIVEDCLRRRASRTAG